MKKYVVANFIFDKYDMFFGTLIINFDSVDFL